jgi:hypothetical protein
VIKRTQKERDQEANTNSGRNLSKQNSQKSSVAQIEKCKNNES